MENLKYKEVLNIVLGYLYFQKFDGNIGFFGLTNILSAIKYPCTKEEINEIGRYLEAKDYIKVIFQIDDVYVKIMTQGIIFVEGLIERNEIKEEYIKDIMKVVKQKAQSENEIERPNREQIKARRKDILKTLSHMKRKLGNAANPQIYDLRIDLDIIKLELEKLDPDKDIIKQKIMKLDYNPRIREDINGLFNELNLYY